MLGIIELLAVMTYAIYGALLGIRKEFDFVGIFTVAFFVSLGGGTLRDLFLNRHPVFWIEVPHYILVIFAACVLVSIAPRTIIKLSKYLHIPDALGLGLFTTIGAGYALESGTIYYIAVLIGVITGTFGGVIGDVVCNEIPSLFRSAPLYATCSFLGAWIFIFLNQLPLPSIVSVLACVIFIFALRLIALKYDIKLPVKKPASRPITSTQDEHT